MQNRPYPKALRPEICYYCNTLCTYLLLFFSQVPQVTAPAPKHPIPLQQQAIENENFRYLIKQSTITYSKQPNNYYVISFFDFKFLSRDPF